MNRTTYKKMFFHHFRTQNQIFNPKMKNIPIFVLLLLCMVSCQDNLILDTTTRISGKYTGIKQKKWIRLPAAPDTVVGSNVGEVLVIKDPDENYNRFKTSANIFVDAQIAIFYLQDRTFEALKTNNLGMTGAFFYNDSLSFDNVSEELGLRYVTSFRGKRKN